MKNQPLSWSYSRATLLYYCEKKYLFSYYTKHFAKFDWNFYQEILILKNLSSMSMWLWTKIHGLMSDYLHMLKDKLDTWVSQVEIDKLLANFIEEMDEEYHKSQNKDYTQYDRDDHFGLTEHFYWEHIDTQFEEWKQHIISYFHAFLHSDLHKKIYKEFSHAEQIFVEPKDPDFEQMKMTIDRIPELKWIQLRAQADMWIVLPPSKSNNKKIYIIYDWKSWKERDAPDDFISDQLKVYAYKTLLNIWMDKIDEVEIYCYEVFLKTMKILWWKISRDDIYHIEQKITLDVSNQKKFLLQQNPFKNIPIDSVYFNKTSNTNKCKHCRFRQACDALSQYESQSNEQFFT